MIDVTHDESERGREYVRAWAGPDPRFARPATDPLPEAEQGRSGPTAPSRSEVLTGTT